MTALLDPSRIKWKDLVTPGVALPTFWPKTEFETYARGNTSIVSSGTELSASPSV